MPVRFGLCAAALFLAGLASGCASIYAKGTPFYDGPAVSQGKLSDAERANVWPLAYYQKPNLSVLWPLFEKTPDHLALRPLWSVYKLDEPEHEYNVLWPLVQFDMQEDEHRIFPFFWGGGPGHRYFVLFPEAGWKQGGGKFVFPFFWNWDPKDRYLVTFPLFWYVKDEYCHFFPLWLHSPGDTDVLWPVFNWKDTAESRGWRFWPLYGDYRDKQGDGRKVFALWPLGHYWREGGGQGLAVVPVYFQSARGASGWRLVLPAYFGMWSGGGSLHVTPLWASFRDGDAGWSTLVPLYFRSVDAGRKTSLLITPLWMSGRNDRARWDLLIPLCYRSADPASKKSLLVTPLWASGRSGDAGWNMLVPLFYQSFDPEKKTSRLITPLFGRLGRGDQTRWLLVPAFSSVAWGREEKDLWALGPLVHARWGGARHQSHFFPLYYYDREDRLFLSPLYASGGQGAHWNLCLPLCFRWADAERKSGLLVTPLFGGLTRGDRSSWLILPVLSFASWDQADRNVWALGPLAHARWGGARHQSHVFPLYYYDREEKLFVSLPFSRGRGGGEFWKRLADQPTSPRDDGGFWNVLGLAAHYSWDGQGRKTFYAIPPLTAFGWGPDYQRTSVYPLFSTERAGVRRETWVLPWFLFESRPDRHENSFFPFWSWASHRDASGYDRDFRILGWLYENHQRNIGAKAPGGEGEAVRTRVLWKLVDYQRAKNDKSLDCFPFISWDSRENGFRRFAFAWRLFRNETTAGGGRKLDILFIPIVRRAGRPEKAPEPAPASALAEAQP